MPTYQYACTACDHRFEKVQAFTDTALTECPECSGRLRKLYGSVGVVFKGSGFYRTDSRAKSTSSASAESGSGAKESTSSNAAGSGSSSGSGSGDKSNSSSSTTSTTTPAAKAS